MIIEETGLEGIEISIRDLDYAMKHIGFIRWAWDYKRATYDYKYVDNTTGETYYVRLPAEAIEGIIEDAGHAIVRVGQPYIGTYTYPRGVVYDREIPQHILKKAKEKLAGLNNILKQKQQDQ